MDPPLVNYACVVDKVSILLQTVAVLPEAELHVDRGGKKKEKEITPSCSNLFPPPCKPSNQCGPLMYI